MYTGHPFVQEGSLARRVYTDMWTTILSKLIFSKNTSHSTFLTATGRKSQGEVASHTYLGVANIPSSDSQSYIFHGTR